MKELLEQSKKGVASLYIVIFATILFGVITLSFIRITVSELSQTNDSDLSQSAYDAALAGVEDAKVLVNQYYTFKNLGTGYNPGTEEEIFSGDDCYVLNKRLYGNNEESEVPIQETSSGDGNSANQAYTCVLLKNKVADYKLTLDPSSRVQVVPLAVDNDVSGLAQVEFSWYTEDNGTELKNIHNDSLFYVAGQETTPPMVTLGLISVGDTVTLSDVGDEDNSTDDFGDRDSTDFTTTALLPSEQDDGTKENIVGAWVSSAYLEGAANATIENKAFRVKCEKPGQDRDYACIATLDVKSIVDEHSVAGKGNAYLVVSMPYGRVETSCRVVKKDENGNNIPFKDTQISVDSTGRASDLYRRVEARISPAATDFPFPQFELDLSGESNGQDHILNKNFWVTKNCWGTNCSNSGQSRD